VQANIRYYYQLVEIESTGKQNILGVTSVLPGHTGLIEGSAGIVCIVVGVILLKIPGTNYGKPIYGRV
jgi:pyruvoyl-dependent arginine decarboxylase (PvlArgDC)